MSRSSGPRTPSGSRGVTTCTAGQSPTCPDVAGWLDRARMMRGPPRVPGVRSVLVNLDLDTKAVGDHTVVLVGGEIDVYTAPQLRGKLIDLVGAGHYHLLLAM